MADGDEVVNAAVPVDAEGDAMDLDAPDRPGEEQAAVTAVAQAPAFPTAGAAPLEGGEEPEPNSSSDDPLRRDEPDPLIRLENGNLYTLDSLYKRREKAGHVEYFVRFNEEKVFDWVDEERLREVPAYTEMIDKWNAAQEAAKAEKESDATRGIKRGRGDDDKRLSKKKRIDPDRPSLGVSVGHVGFDYGDQVEEIVGARMIDGKLHHYVLWKTRNVCTFVPAEETNKRVPQKVISFYETRILFERPFPATGTRDMAQAAKEGHGA